MCLKARLKKVVESEKNIKIRERHEQTMKRNYNIFLILFLGGGYLVCRNLLTFNEGIILAMVFLAWYGFLESVQAKYSQYTDGLIRKGALKGKQK